MPPNGNHMARVAGIKKLRVVTVVSDFLGLLMLCNNTEMLIATTFHSFQAVAATVAIATTAAETTTTTATAAIATVATTEERPRALTLSDISWLSSDGNGWIQINNASEAYFVPSDYEYVSC